MKETAHLRITAQEAKELYLSGLFTAQTYLYILVRALRKDGWWLYFDVKEFCQEWGIPERSFYRAKAILVSKGYLEEDIKGQIGLRCPVEDEDPATSGSPTATSGSPTATSGSPTATSGSLTATCGSPTATSGRATATSGRATATSGRTTATSGRGRHPKPAQDKASTAPTDLDQISSHLSSDLLHVEDEKKSLSSNEQSEGREGLVDRGGGAIDVAKILEETKKKLMEEVERQREQRRGRNFRGGAALGALEAVQGDSPDLAATAGSPMSGNGLHLGATVATVDTTPRQGQWCQEEGPTSRGYSGHGGHYRWRVRGGGLQPLVEVIQQYRPKAVAEDEFSPLQT